MTKLGIQISSVRKYLQTPVDVLESFRKVSKIGYRNIQIQWISPDVPAGFIKDAMEETQLNCIGTQDYYDEVVPNLDEIIKMNDLWGGRYICISGIPERYCSFEGCMTMASEINQISKRLSAAGKILVFHPRAQEFEKYDGKIALDILFENTENDFQVELDTYNVIKAGYDPVNWIHKVKGRMDLIHFKDMTVELSGDEVLMPVGQGTTKWMEIFRACHETGVQYGFAEQESWQKDPFECLEDSYRFLTENDIQ